jgi:colanic acid/amylovoran biosynthesis glycosyltransferase
MPVYGCGYNAAGVDAIFVVIVAGEKFSEMNIALIVSTFPSISQTFVLNQITGLIDHGHNVDIFARSKDQHDKIHQDVATYRLLQRTTYLSVIPNRRLKRFRTGILMAAKAFPKYPRIVLQSFNILKYGKKAASLSLPIAVLPFMEKCYDILHCHFGPNGDFGIFLRKIGATSGKVVTTFHGSDISRYIKTGGSHAYESLFRRGELFLPISNYWREKLIGLGSPPEKTVVHRMGIDVRKYRFVPGKDFKNDRVRILTVARLVEKKGVKYGILALEKLVRRFPNIEYNIAGDGPLRKELNSLINSLSLNHNINLLGWKDQDEMQHIMQRADILLAPSVTGKDGDKEGIPVVLMEAMAVGLPVISTFHSGIPEIVINNETGLLVREGDVEGLSQKIADLIVNSNLRIHLRQKARKHVEENYDINKLNVALIELFEQMLR